MSVPISRLRRLNDAPVRTDGQYVFYWMVAARRPRFNFALEQATLWAKQLNKPLVILEALRIDYPWASPRLHRFVMEGMAANAAYFSNTSVTYYPYIEPAPGAGAGLIEAFAERACVIVTDEYPAFFIPRMQAKAASFVKVRMETIDTNGFLPLSAAEGRAFTTAYSFRRFMQNALPQALSEAPSEEPTLNLKLPRLQKLPAALRFRWPCATTVRLTETERTLSSLNFVAQVKPVDVEGGWISAHWALYRFAERRLQNYLDGRNHPDDEVTSGLSPWLHFGHLSVHDILKALSEVERWKGIPADAVKNGSREGFWGFSANAEAFLDQLVTWRELAFNTALNLPDYDQYESLPAWARATLEKHASDERPYLYSLGALEDAETHDPLWNAAQRELVQDGTLHNYMRMLWGKKILEWSESPRVALEHMIHLNNKYALDGRDPNSYAGIFWIFGRYDRPWAPERAIFGQIRYMSSASARRKLRLETYLKKYARRDPGSQQSLGYEAKALR